MPLLRCMVVIPADTALSRDAVVNNYGIEVAGTADTSRDNIVTALRAFYEAWNAQRAITMDWTNARVKAYDLAHEKPRSPVFDVSLGLLAGTGTTALPHEVALCCSFQRIKGSGVNMRRGRGRVYLGPFAAIAADTATGRPNSTLITAVRNGAQGFLDASRTANDWEWQVISEASGVPIGTPVNNGWVDNAWDTQRRRGPDASTRVVFTPAA